FQGKVTKKDDVLQLLSPDYHLEGDPGQGFPGLIPVYSLPSELFPRTFHRMIDEILAGLQKEPVADWRESSELPEREFMSLDQALRSVHRPGSPAEAEAARRRIAYEEFFSFQLGLAMQRAKRKGAGGGAKKRKVPRTLDATYQKCLPFELTRAQQAAVHEIKQDLESPHPMHRLLQGDVGSGKTAVALFPLLAAALSGGQAALMAPTEVLAGQHFHVLESLLAPAGILPVLLPAGQSKNTVKKMLDHPDAKIVVGTHALIQERVVFPDLRTCVIDEQHKFGVRQRWNLKAKGPEPDVLVMTATPIPRSLALTLYGELDITVLDMLPPGRKPVRTETVKSLDDDDLQAWIEEEIETKGRIFFVCPLIHESEKLDLEAAVRLHARLKKQFEPLCKVGLLHGNLSQKEKTKAILDFRDGKTLLLVTTVVVEVGVDVPEASTVVILDAWRFGLAQLHQIRGRVGRGERPSRCYLVGEPTTDAGEERLRILVGTSDGFRIAEEDLKMRGPGEALGLKQHGLPALRAGDYVGDLDLMTAARDDARRFLASSAVSNLQGFLFPIDRQSTTWIG
ncbi:MAG: ATP-dependent DNA helicase RecG, partial [Planctomycetota bacterium]